MASRERALSTSHKIGRVLVSGFHVVALFVIGATIVWAAVLAYVEMIRAGGVGLHDILLLFIYLELGAMVGIYFVTDRLPVRFLLYIAITAMTRFLVIDVTKTHNEEVLIYAGAIFVLTISILVLQIGDTRFASREEGSTQKAFPRPGKK